MNKLTHWSYRRQYLGKRGKNAAQVLKDIVGVYSWHPSAPLSLWNRITSFTKKDFNVLDEKRLAIRIPAMRLSNYMLEKDMAFRIFAAAIPAPSEPYWEKRYGKFVPSEKYYDWRDQILDLTKQQPVSLAQIKEASKDIPANLLKIMLNRMAFEGIILRVGSENLRSNIIQYVASETWVGRSLMVSHRERALRMLATAYFNAFGPARIKDFKWWAGLTMNVAKRAVSEIDTLDIGNGFLLPSNQIKEFESFKTPVNDVIDLLPQWDSYIMGYAPDGRERFATPDMQEQIYGKIGATGGNGLGTILVNGMAYGSWNAKFKGIQMSVHLNMFEKPSSKLYEAIKLKFDEMAAFMEVKKLTYAHD